MHVAWFSMWAGYFSPVSESHASRLRILYTLSHVNHHAKYIAQNWRSWKPCVIFISHTCSQDWGKSEIHVYDTEKPICIVNIGCANMYLYQSLFIWIISDGIFVHTKTTICRNTQIKAFIEHSRSDVKSIYMYMYTYRYVLSLLTISTGLGLI